MTKTRLGRTRAGSRDETHTARVGHIAARHAAKEESHDRDRTISRMA